MPRPAKTSINGRRPDGPRSLLASPKTHAAQPRCRPAISRQAKAFWAAAPHGSLGTPIPKIPKPNGPDFQSLQPAVYSLQPTAFPFLSPKTRSTTKSSTRQVVKVPVSPRVVLIFECRWAMSARRRALSFMPANPQAAPECKPVRRIQCGVLNFAPRSSRAGDIRLASGRLPF